MLSTRKLHICVCTIAFLCIQTMLWAVPSAANTVLTEELFPSALELPKLEQPQEAYSNATLDFLVIQEDGPAVATCTVEMDIVPGMNKVVVSDVPNTVECSTAELLLGTVPFNVVSSEIDRTLGELVFNVEVEAASRAVFKITYRFSGATWRASYNALLEPERDDAQIWASYSVRNETDCDLAPDKLVLVADPTNILQAKPGFKGDYALGKTVATIDSPKPLAAGSERNIRFAGGTEVPARLVYMVDWAQAGTGMSDSLSQEKDTRPVMLGLEFSVSSDSGLGCPLPGGCISVFSRSEEGATFFLGEDTVSPCPADATLMAKLGPVPSLTAVRTRTDQRKVGTSSWEEAYQVRIVNAGTTDAAVIDIEEFPGQWTILQTNTPTAAIVSGRAHLSTTVPAGGQANILFRVRYTL